MAYNLRTYEASVVGLKWPNADGSERWQNAALLEPGYELELRRDPLNPYDPGAVSVFYEGKQVGFIARKYAYVHEMIDKGDAIRCVLEFMYDDGAPNPRATSMRVRIEVLGDWSAG